MNIFLDSDKVECVLVSEAKNKYPELDWDVISERFGWTINDLPTDEVRMALADLKWCIEVTKRGLGKQLLELANSDYYTDSTVCSVCGKILLGDDEAYNDFHTNNSLCDKHSEFSEALDAYVAVGK